MSACIKDGWRAGVAARGEMGVVYPIGMRGRAALYSI